VLFKFLLSEIAAQRGNLQLAAQGYLEMAKTTRDPRLAKRATEIAAYGRLQNLALESARLWLELDKTNAQARQTVAALLVSGNKLSEAKPLLEAMINADGNVAAGFLQLNSMLAKHPDHNAVLTITKGLAKGYPQLAEAHLAVAQAAFAASKYDVATAEVKEAQDQAGLGDRGLVQRPDPATARIQCQGYGVSAGVPEDSSRRGSGRTTRMLINKQLKEARAEYQVLLVDQPTNSDIAVTICCRSDYATAETWLCAVSNSSRSGRVALYPAGQ
jgi:tetratricopeptide (TPR) repeat protein